MLNAVFQTDMSKLLKLLLHKLQKHGGETTRNKQQFHTEVKDVALVDGCVFTFDQLTTGELVII